MTDTVPQTTVPTSRSVGDDGLEVYDDTDPFSGWLFFAATMLGLAGFMRIIDSIWAFSYHGNLPEGLKDSVLGSSLHTYGWTWMLVGLLLITSSFLVMVRSQFGRWVGLFAAAVGGLSAMAWMPYYPVWSFTYIGMAVLVFYALAAHGGREAT